MQRFIKKQIAYFVWEIKTLLSLAELFFFPDHILTKQVDLVFSALIT